MTTPLLHALFSCGFVALAALAMATKLAELRPADELHVTVHWVDSEVRYNDSGEGKGAFQGHESAGGDEMVVHGEPLDLAWAQQSGSYTLTSLDDPDYKQPLHPVAAFRKTKAGGAPMVWPEPPYGLEHTIFLRLAKPLEQGCRYELRIAPELKSDQTSAAFTFDAYTGLSEAIHVNLLGYLPGDPTKSADLYLWMGDGGQRDYSAYEGRQAVLVDVATGQKHPAGQVRLWKKGGPDYGGWNLTRSDVWSCDLGAFARPGRYRLAIEGIGCSREFVIGADAYDLPYRTSVRGFFYMRIGQDTSISPPPRQPRFIPGVDPVGFKVIRTTYGPFHPDWRKGQGDQWDVKDWSKYAEPGNPTNPNAFGGHSDALDWDRHMGHIAIIWDMLLPYLLTGGALGQDDIGIAESGNGVPDLIDEARDEVDLWLRLRDGEGGYATGLNNPSNDHMVMYQAAAKPVMAWANAANAAMLAEAYRVAGKPDLAEQYKLAALEAWETAGEQDLDLAFDTGESTVRGRDLKMMAAAFLYNLTGAKGYEDIVASESVCREGGVPVDEKGKYCQIWGTAAYLLCARDQVQPVRHPELVERMRANVIAEAMAKGVEASKARPSRRSSDEAYGWWQTRQEVQRLCLAHAVAQDEATKQELLRALLLEADYGLGRNPMNMVQMTGLGSRHVDDIYTSGRNDGFPGVHPGHTPYMNSEPWGTGFMADPKWYANKGYPEWPLWPHGEAFWPARYCYSNNEFTPQQTMRGKMCLLGYLAGLQQ